MINKTRKFAFTLSEVMVCLAVFSVIATMLMPSINPERPNKARTMFKKGYNNVERAVYEMIHDEDFYPSKDGKPGLSNTEATDLLPAGGSKFCNAFKLKMNTSGDCPNVVTSDGIRYYLPGTPTNWHTDANANTEYTITISTAAPGTPDKSDADPPTACSKGTNTFEVNIKRDGKMRVTKSCAKAYMEQVNLLKDD